MVVSSRLLKHSDPARLALRRRRDHVQGDSTRRTDVDMPDCIPGEQSAAQPRHGARLHPWPHRRRLLLADQPPPARHLMPRHWLRALAASARFPRYSEPPAGTDPYRHSGFAVRRVLADCLVLFLSGRVGGPDRRISAARTRRRLLKIDALPGWGRMHYRRYRPPGLHARFRAAEHGSGPLFGCPSARHRTVRPGAGAISTSSGAGGIMGQRLAPALYQEKVGLSRSPPPAHQHLTSLSRSPSRCENSAGALWRKGGCRQRHD